MQFYQQTLSIFLSTILVPGVDFSIICKLNVNVFVLDSFTSVFRSKIKVWVFSL